MSGKISVAVTREWLAKVISQTDHGPDVPEDVGIVGIAYNADQDLYEVVLESDGIDHVSEGGQLPHSDNVLGGND